MELKVVDHAKPKEKSGIQKRGETPPPFKVGGGVKGPAGQKVPRPKKEHPKPWCREGGKYHRQGKEKSNLTRKNREMTCSKVRGARGRPNREAVENGRKSGVAGNTWSPGNVQGRAAKNQRQNRTERRDGGVRVRRT